VLAVGILFEGKEAKPRYEKKISNFLRNGHVCKRSFLFSDSVLAGALTNMKRCRSISESFDSRIFNRFPDTPSTFKLEMETVTASPTRVESVLVNTDTDVRFRMELVGLKDNTFRVRVREAFPLVPRFEVPHVLDGEPEQATVEVKDRTDTGLTLHNGPNKVVVTASPLRLDFYSNGALTLTANARNLMRFEHTRAKAQDGGAGEAEQAENAADDDPNMWEESFSGNTDSKPHGPQAIAMDFTFHDTDHVYGIPEHADKFSLQDTMSGDPYRLYNLDVFEYELWNQMALYAAIPFMIGHNAKRTTGLFWMNAAETWIDVKKSSSGVLGSLTNLVSR
jgi:alpha 1,3-glucosidase